MTPNQLNFCNHPQQTVNPKANLHEALGGSSCSPGQQQPGDADIHLPGALFPSFYTSPLCNCSIVPNPSPVTQGGAGGSPGHPAYSLITPRLHWAYAKAARPRELQLGHKLQRVTTHERTSSQNPPNTTGTNIYMPGYNSSNQDGAFLQVFFHEPLLCNLHRHVFISNWIYFPEVPDLRALP